MNHLEGGTFTAREEMHPKGVIGCIVDRDRPRFYRTIKVRDGARDVKVPMAQAIIRALAVNAANGNQRTQRLFTDLFSTTERENRQL